MLLSLITGCMEDLTTLKIPGVKRTFHQAVGWKAEDFFNDSAVIELCDAIEANDVAKMKQLIAEGVDVNAVGDGGVTPLLWAFVDNQPERFQLLLEHGADPNDSESVRSSVDLIHERAHQNSRSLIVREWSHLDWIGFPFEASPPMRFTWDDPKNQRIAIDEPVEWWIHSIFEKVVTASSSMVRLKFKKHSKCEPRDSNLSNNHSLFRIVRN
ncbi:hypothetical protein FHS27_005713 [Rhodopirellula rubra]|uniref:Ankyrin repeat protein n=1 Tax=Aporhodopirellula rubra TaxID=980271 RepID=A0A7W5E4C5_9BACT|nr:hypothetical protein [Aporhodopirellula rubra]